MKKHHNVKNKPQQLSGTILFLILTTLSFFVVAIIFFFQDQKSFTLSTSYGVAYPIILIALLASASLFGFYYIIFYKDKLAKHVPLISLALVSVSFIALFVGHFGTLMEKITAANNQTSVITEYWAKSLPFFIEPIVCAIAFGVLTKSIALGKPNKYAFCIGFAFALVPRFAEAFTGIGDMITSFDKLDVYPFFYIIGRISLLLMLFAFVRSNYMKK